LLSRANFHLNDGPAFAPAPSVAFATHETYRRIYRAGLPFEGSPNLAVEVVSTTNTVRGLTGKTEAYIRAGAQRVWIVEPATQSVTVLRPDWTARTLHLGESLTSDDAGFSVDGFALPLEQVFTR
jgi:Uma2 family endonuclease